MAALTACKQKNSGIDGSEPEKAALTALSRKKTVLTALNRENSGINGVEQKKNCGVNGV